MFIVNKHVHGSCVFPYIFIAQKGTAQNVETDLICFTVWSSVVYSSFCTGSRSWEWLPSL